MTYLVIEDMISGRGKGDRMSPSMSGCPALRCVQYIGVSTGYLAQLAVRPLSGGRRSGALVTVCVDEEGGNLCVHGRGSIGVGARWGLVGPCKRQMVQYVQL
jgi:hypothetical protein